MSKFSKCDRYNRGAKGRKRGRDYNKSKKGEKRKKTYNENNADHIRELAAARQKEKRKRDKQVSSNLNGARLSSAGAAGSTTGR